MKDIQSQLDDRRINIKKVGVKDISYPITVLDKKKKVQRTVAKVNMSVNLPHRFKGTHMSRFVEILNRCHGEIHLKNIQAVLTEMKEKLAAPAAHMEVVFSYFLKKNNGVVDSITIGEYGCKMHGSLDREYDLSLEIKVPIASPAREQDSVGMPRSLGQWGNAKVCFRFRHFIWLEDLIQMIEEVIAACQSSRRDTAASGPRMTVEEITLALGERLASQADIRWFSIVVENLADGYNTFASMEWPGTTNVIKQKFSAGTDCRHRNDSTRTCISPVTD